MLKLSKRAVSNGWVLVGMEEQTDSRCKKSHNFNKMAERDLKITPNLIKFVITTRFFLKFLVYALWQTDGQNIYRIDASC